VYRAPTASAVEVIGALWVVMFVGNELTAGATTGGGATRTGPFPGGGVVGNHPWHERSRHR
jgi:hypothetical protein